jgi:hypothetical protein
MFCQRQYYAALDIHPGIRHRNHVDARFVMCVWYQDGLMFPTAILLYMDATLWMYLLSANIQLLFFCMLKIKQVGWWRLLHSIYCHVMRDNQSAAVKTLVSVLYFTSYECSDLPYRNNFGLVTFNRDTASEVNYTKYIAIYNVLA